jgi:hypothetical protein
MEQPFRADHSARLFGIGKHRAKLIAAITRNEIGRIGRRCAQQHRKLAQKRIPAGMPVGVIPTFKPVDNFQVRTTLAEDPAPSVIPQGSHEAQVWPD